MEREIRTMPATFNLSSSPSKVAKTIQRKMLRDNFDEAMVKVPVLDHEILIGKDVPLTQIEEFVRSEQIAAKKAKERIERDRKIAAKKAKVELGL